VPGLQAAFVNIGLERERVPALLRYVGDYILPGKGLSRPPARRGHSRGRPGPRCRKAARKAMSRKRRSPRPQARADEVGRQGPGPVVKSPSAAKGARVTANVSLPGRYLVFLPSATARPAASRAAIEDMGERKR